MVDKTSGRAQGDASVVTSDSRSPRTVGVRVASFLRCRHLSVAHQTRLQLLPHDGEGAPAMADAVLQRGCDLRRRQAALEIEKHRVVTEAAVSARLSQDAAFPAPLGNQRLRIGGVTQQHQYAMKPSSPFALRDSVEFAQEPFDVACRITVHSAVARGEKAWGSTENIDTQPGIVSEGGQAADQCRVPGLEQCVLYERLSSLVDIGDVEVGLAARSATRNDEDLNLTSVEFELLVALLKDAGKVIRKEDLSMDVLEREISPYDRSLDMHISNLRKKLDNDRIKTIRSVGYIYTIL